MPKDFESAVRTLELVAIHEDAVKVLASKGESHYAPAVETLAKEVARLKGTFEAKPAPAPAAAPKRRR